MTVAVYPTVPRGELLIEAPRPKLRTLQNAAIPYPVDPSIPLAWRYADVLTDALHVPLAIRGPLAPSQVGPGVRSPDRVHRHPS